MGFTIKDNDMKLPERMPKGHYLYRDKTTVRKIAQVKRHPEYKEERVYILEGQYGNLLEPQEVAELEKVGFIKCISQEELNKMFRNGDYIPSDGQLTLRRKK